MLKLCTPRKFWNKNSWHFTICCWRFSFYNTFTVIRLFSGLRYDHKPFNPQGFACLHHPGAKNPPKWWGILTPETSFWRSAFSQKTVVKWPIKTSMFRKKSWQVGGFQTLRKNIKTSHQAICWKWIAQATWKGRVESGMKCFMSWWFTCLLQTLCWVECLNHGPCFMKNMANSCNQLSDLPSCSHLKVEDHRKCSQGKAPCKALPGRAPLWNGSLSVAVISCLDFQIGSLQNLSPKVPSDQYGLICKIPLTRTHMPQKLGSNMDWMR